MPRRRACGVRSSIFALLTVVVTATGGVGLAAAGPPEPIPPRAWTPADSLPLADIQHWPDLASVAEPLEGRPFFAEEACGVSPSPKRQFSSEQARARVESGPGRWSLQQQIVHFPGQASSDRAGQLFDSVADALARCSTLAPGVVADITTPREPCAPQHCTQTAATLRTPGGVTAHLYLSVIGAGVSELAVWSVGVPDVPWSAPPDDAVLAAINAPLCATWRC